ncbi:hypothetical protein BWQ96_04427 [Gracilariopsis chorda]|uniref:Tudor domain-containing protein n=1 Tax=Gracilariopsis chorda TaxID=448386 RepID=A0A2V3IUN3_9FLOR|nr:hypothetical protein BWQ96_04427 [Gracilariopsis chorda]|eukprot:PXF45815.1 hypothetical protein BWQ96_04427 [Gracilariopsis chorda]
MTPGSAAELPNVNQRVDIWFDGYDEYYPGRVTSIVAPYEFNVVLEDGTDWTIDSRKHVFKFPDEPAEQPQTVKKTVGRPKNASTTTKKMDDDSEKQVSADDNPEQNGGAQARRRMGRALRKNATPTRTVEPDVDEEPDEPSDDANQDQDDYNPKDDEINDQRLPRLRRSARVADEERERRTTRSRAKPIQEPVGLPPRTRKRSLSKRAPETTDEERSSKRRRRMEEEADRMDDDVARDDDGMAGLSTKAVTAIAVEAALESAKAVLKPLSEKMTFIVTQFAEINKLMKQTAEDAAKDAVQKVVGKPDESKGTLAALANFKLNISEIIGGGEARIEAFSNLSEQEFEHLNRLVEHQGKALKELERLLYAAREFGKKKVLEEAAAPPSKEVEKATDK